MSEFPLYVDHDRAASLLGCSVAKVEQAVADAGIKSKRYGRRLYFSRAGCEGASRRADVLLSADGNPFDVARVTEKPPTNRSRAALSLEAVAKASGLDPADLQSRVLGRCKLGVHDGRLMIRLSDLDRLAAERETLRSRLADSPIGNAEVYARAVEDVYRQLWQRWCASPLDHTS